MANPTLHIGFGVTKTVGGEVVPDYATEMTNNNTSIGKLANAIVELLKRHHIKGTGGVVGTYDATLIGECALRLYNGAQDSDTGYGLVARRTMFETAKLL